MVNSARWPTIRRDSPSASSLFCATPSVPPPWRSARVPKWKRSGTWLRSRGGWWKATKSWSRRSGREGLPAAVAHALVRAASSLHSTALRQEAGVGKSADAARRRACATSASLPFQLGLDAVYNVGGRAIQISRGPTLCRLRYRPDYSARLGVPQKDGAPGAPERRTG